MNTNEPNEYEIIDSKVELNPVNMNNTYPKYPIASNPNSALQNTNYKDWLAMCQRNNQYDEHLMPSAIDTLSAVSAGIIVVGTMMSAFFAPVTSAVLISFGTLAPVLWPDGSKTVWTQFMDFGETLLDEKISVAVRENALATLVGLQRLLDQYEFYLTKWQESPNKDTAFDVDRLCARIHEDFIKEMPQFEMPSYRVLLLPVYAQAANLHLNLLQQGAQFADKWKADMLQTTNRISSNDYYDELLKYTEIYIDYCSKTYREGLTTLFNRKARYTAYNTYRKDMTLTVLDLIATFPNYDFRKYRIGTSSELTRDVYTTFIDSLSDEWVSLDKLLFYLTRSPHLFNSLNRLDLYSYPYGTTIPSLTANINFSLNINASSLIESPKYGPVEWQSINNKITQYNIPKEVNVVSVMLNYLETHRITRMFFDQTNSSHFKFLDHQGPNSIEFNFPTLKADSTLVHNHSHILNYMKTYAALPNINPEGSRLVSFAWTHVNVNSNNTITANTITQIRGVKARFLSPQSKVVKGPEHLGGDLVQLAGIMEFSCRTASELTRYAIRIRYAANRFTTISLNIVGVGTYFTNVQPTFSNESIETLRYNHFQYQDIVTLNMPVNLPQNQNIIIQLLRNEIDPSVLIDRIEFIPLTVSLVSYNEEQKLKKAKDAVTSLFMNNSLKSEITDYQIDQIANQVECISEELYLQEKMKLLDKIKFAKQLSQSRNLLVNGDFESLIGWNSNNDVTIQEHNPTFKGHYLNMPGARMIEISNNVFPTQIYQKIDETKLKPYTRYKVRGYIESSKNLELLVMRYDKEVSTTMNIQYGLTHQGSVNSCSKLNQCDLHSSRNVSTLVQTTCHDPKEFSFHIDTGELDFMENPSIWVIFNISDPNGYATLGNLEVIEDKTLAGEDLKHVKHLEQKWKEYMASKRKKTEEVFYQAKEAVDALFIETQNPLLKNETTLVNILSARYIIDSIPYVYNEYLPDNPGMNYAMYNELNNKLIQAYCLYDIRNKIKNGHFTNGLMHWHASPDAQIQKIDDTSILVIPNWSTQVSQNIELKQSHRYMLRVTAKKEGLGTGYVRISDCTNHIETIVFTASDNNTNEMSSAIEYITKTVDISLSKNKIRIDIGETEGLFKIASLELICL